MVGAKPLAWAPSVLVRLPISMRTFAEDISSSRGAADFRNYAIGGRCPGLRRGSPERDRQRRWRASGWKAASDTYDFGLLTRSGPMLFVSADVLFTATLGTRSESALTVRSGPVEAGTTSGQTRADVRADNAAVVLMTWAEARALGISHPDGDATESGWHLPPVRPSRDTAAATGVFGDPGELELASAAQLLPAVQDWNLISGRATSDGRMLLHGEPVEPAHLMDTLAGHSRGTERGPIVLVASGALRAARRLAGQTGLPVVATNGQVVFSPDRGVRVETPITAGLTDGREQTSHASSLLRGGSGWVLVTPDHARPYSP